MYSYKVFVKGISPHEMYYCTFAYTLGFPFRYEIGVLHLTRVEYVKGGAAPLFLMGQVFEVFFEVFSLFCRIIMDYVRTQIRASF